MKWINLILSIVMWCIWGSANALPVTTTNDHHFITIDDRTEQVYLLSIDHTLCDNALCFEEDAHCHSSQCCFYMTLFPRVCIVDGHSNDFLTFYPDESYFTYFPPRGRPPKIIFNY